MKTTNLHNYIPKKSYIAHFGILGQKWGVRRYQNYDGTLTSLGKDRYSKYGDRVTELKKGTTVYRTTVGEKDTEREGKYVTYNPVDRNMYRGIRNMLTRYNLKNDKNYQKLLQDAKNAIEKGDNEEAQKVLLEANKIATSKILYEHQYVLTEDLKIPDTKTAEEWANNLIKNDPNVRREIYYRGNQKESKSKAYESTIFDKYSDDLKLDEFFWSLGYSDYNAKAFFKELKREGYNAVTDYAGVGGRSDGVKEGIQPLIVMYADTLLKEVNSTPISEIDSKISLDDYSKWYKPRNTVNERKKRIGSI